MDTEINTVTSDSDQKSKPYPIVAIGASAGGLEAMVELLENLPSNTGMAFVYIQHLDPGHDSKLPEILSRATKMKVYEGRNLMKIEPDSLFIIPPNKEMSIVNGVIKIFPRPVNNHMPIDRFFTSLAEKQKEGAIGILLSGALNDGTVGLKVIKEAGGITFAQDSTARFQSMPMSAIAEGAVDLVFPPKQIAKELDRLSKQVDIFKLTQINNEDELPAENDAEINTILQLINKSTGVDFTQYKINTIRRRIIRRMLLHKLTGLPEYVQYLKQHVNEIISLYSDLLINVTCFFRDFDTIDYLQNILLPQIINNKSSNDDPLRIWIPACSTGEEAYSMAMMVLEVLGDKAPHVSVQIFATDLSDMAISKARPGLYMANDVINISPARLQRFFTKVEGNYQIIKPIRDLCVFAPHNIFRDPPFSRLDLISCCNLLIYLDHSLQKKIIQTFHYALNETGYLLLGKSETVGASSHLFTPMDKKAKIFVKKKVASPKIMIDTKYHLQEKQRRDQANDNGSAEKEQTSPANLEKIIDTIFLTQYVPASVVINHGLEILQFRGATSLFLEPSSGKASLNVLKMVKPGIGFELRTAIHKCIKSGETLKKTGIQIKLKNSIRHVCFEVQPLDIRSHEPLLLIIFEESNILNENLHIPQSKDQQVRQLENEIINISEDMRTLVEDQQSANEELQSANEEILSSNEELQSMNEELETSKEEIESSNEELVTTNQELFVKNDQLTEAHEYAEAVIATINEAVIILDKNLRVKRANKAFYRTFHLCEAITEGHYIFDLANKQWNLPKLKELLEEILPQNAAFHGTEITHDFPGIGEKVLIFNARKLIPKTTSEQVILLAIEDITDYKHNERLLAEREAWLRNMTENVPAMIWVAGAHKKYLYVNKTFLAFTGRSPEQEMGNGWMDNIHKDDLADLLEKYNFCCDSRKPFNMEYRLKRNDGKYRWISCSAVPTFTTEDVFSGFCGFCLEIHDKKLINQELEKRVETRTKEIQEINARLERSNRELDQFAYVASHDLQEPLRKILTFSNQVKENYINELPEEGKNYINKIGLASQKMRQLIDDLLNFSQSASTTNVFIETDLDTIMKDVLSDFEILIKEKNVVLTIAQLPKAEVIPLQIQQLFHNLISNALKFTKEDIIPYIEITCRLLTNDEANNIAGLEKENRYYEIIFKDNGIGFNGAFAAQAFAIFQRLHEGPKFAGSGIGLALCRKIIDNHKGIISVDAKENTGASFKIILPEKHGLTPSPLTPLQQVREGAFRPLPLPFSNKLP